MGERVHLEAQPSDELRSLVYRDAAPIQGVGVGLRFWFSDAEHANLGVHSGGFSELRRERVTPLAVDACAVTRTYYVLVGEGGFGAAARTPSTMHSETTFSATEVQELIERVRAVARPSAGGPQGWSVSELDPGRIVQAFDPAVRLRAEYVLRGYQYRAGGDGNGVVYAIPVGTSLPRPRKRGESKLPPPPPRPEGALESWVDALELDGTPWSHLCMSLLGREVEEFGAIWHGTSWGVHRVIGRMPWITNDEPAVAEEGWTGEVLGMDELAPRVVTTADEIVVRFYTYTRLGMQRVIEHVDRYQNGRVSVQRRDVATGPGGMVF